MRGHRHAGADHEDGRSVLVPTDEHDEQSERDGEHLGGDVDRPHRVVRHQAVLPRKTGVVAKQHRRQTFAEIVADVESSPPAPPPRPGRHLDRMIDPSGVSYGLVDDISPERALELARDGALVAWDPCGCGGGCGFEWYSPDDVQAMVASGRPTIRRKHPVAGIDEWRSADDAVLLVVNECVTWGPLGRRQASSSV
jgi:hypothetical protein